MRLHFLVITLVFSMTVSAQEERDTVLKRCPVFITDTVSANNFFIEGLSSTIKVFRVHGKLTIEVRQKDQYFTLFFHDKKLKNTIYKIRKGSSSKKEVESRYSFRSADQASYVDISSGTIETTFDTEKNYWHVKVNGMLANRVERAVTYYRVKADFYIRG